MIQIFMYTPQSYVTSPVVWDHTVLTCHPTQVNASHLTPAWNAGSRLT